MAISAKSCVADSTKWQRWQLFLWWITLWGMRSACSRRSKKGTFYFGSNVGIEPRVHKKISLSVECVSWTSGIPYANVQTCVGPQCWGLGVAGRAWLCSEASAWDLWRADVLISWNSQEVWWWVPGVCFPPLTRHWESDPEWSFLCFVAGERCAASWGCPHMG